MKQYVLWLAIASSFLGAMQEERSLTAYECMKHRHFIHSLLRQHENKLFIDPLVSDRRDCIRSCQQAIDDGSMDTLILEVDNQPVGFVSYSFPNKTRGMVELLAVHAANQKKQYGTSMLKYVLAMMREKGVKEINLLVREDNEVAQHLYQHIIGFKVAYKATNYRKLRIHVKDIPC